MDKKLERDKAEDEDPHWCGFTRDLACVPDIMKDGYEWVEMEDKHGKYYVAKKIDAILGNTARQG